MQVVNMIKVSDSVRFRMARIAILTGLMVLLTTIGADLAFRRPSRPSRPRKP